MLTLSLIGFPLLAAVLVLFMKGNSARNAALGFSVIEFAPGYRCLFLSSFRS